MVNVSMVGLPRAESIRGDATPTVVRLLRFAARVRKDGIAFLQEMPAGCNDGADKYLHSFHLLQIVTKRYLPEM